MASIWKDFTPIQLRLNRSKSGFTLIELLIVIAILGILAAGILALINPLAQLAKARDATRKSALKQVATALDAYAIANNGKYPASPPYCAGADGSDTTWIPEGLYPEELQTIPVDPKGNDCWCGDTPHSYCYNYQQRNDGLGYHLLTQLENKDDPSINGSTYGYAGPDASKTDAGAYVWVLPGGQY